MSQAAAPQLVTFGCRLNAFDSEVMRRQAQEAGLHDAIIVNTCAVTAEAERQARQTIRRLRRQNPDATIVVTGCAAQIAPEKFASMPEIDRVLGNGEKLDRRTWHGLARSERVQVADIAALHDTAAHPAQEIDGQSRAFLQVQNGCDHRCTFCIIPFGRGPSRSVPLEDIVRQTRALVRQGYNEVVLSGVDLTDWRERDLRFGHMVERLLELVPELPRLRLSSLDVAEIDPALLRAIGRQPRLMPHFHLSLQAGSDLILKRMKRRHTRRQAIDFCAAVRSLRPDAAFGADLIAGFPTEDESMFQSSLDLVEECGLTFLHVFPFSPRAGTPAARMPQVAGEIRRERAARLRRAGAERLQQFLTAQMGTTAEIVVERDGTGRSANWAPVRPLEPAPARSVQRLRLVAREGAMLIGQAA
jgi:threonylcarbamoyladenosine tRNA methylthiotransferase MtaB